MMQAGSGAHFGCHSIYYTNGLFISSEIPLPELKQLPGNIDVSVRLDNVPESLTGSTYQDRFQEISDNKYLLRIEDVARFLVVDKNEVIVQPSAGAVPSAVRAYLLGPVLGVLLQKNDILTLHAATIKDGCGEGVLFAGHSGTGKSTTALSFYNRGYPVLNDDLSSLDLSGEHTYVYPGVHRLKVSREDLSSLLYSPDGLIKVAVDNDKLSFPVDQITENIPTPVKTIVFLDFAKDGAISMRQLQGIELFSYLDRHVFREDLIKKLGKSRHQFQLLSKLVDKVQFVKVTRPSSITPAEFSDYLVRKIVECN